MRELPQKSVTERGKHGRYVTPETSRTRIPIKKIILILSIGIAIISTVIAIAVVVSQKKKIDGDGDNPVKDGYFYPDDDRFNLHPCSVKNCKKCHGTIASNTCDECFSDYNAKKTNNIIKECTQNNIIPDTVKPTTKPTPQEEIPSTEEEDPNLCIEGPNEKCSKCSETKEECLLCNTGYYLPDDISGQLVCHLCPIKNCKLCSGSSLNTICSECENYAKADNEGDIKSCNVQTGEGPLCKSTNNNECSSCNDGYLLQNGKCVLNYHFKAVFKTRINNENIKLIDKFYYAIDEMTVDGIKLDKKVKTFTFEKKGEHIVYYKLKTLESDSLIGMFEGLNKMTSISFSELFDFSGIKNINRMFYNCQSLKNIDLSNINLLNIENMNYMFYQCLELNSVNLSEIDSSNVNDVSNMFENCIAINTIDISNFNNTDIKINDMFKGVPESGKIIINENLKDKINSLLPNWEIELK